MTKICLLAPLSGEISEIFPKQGELVGQGAPIINIVDLQNCWITFNVREDMLTNTYWYRANGRDSSFK